ncbi:MAG TPA: DUF4388 domain-containing protein, partial [Coleofasciculaceae cyanobacterium]
MPITSSLVDFSLPEIFRFIEKSKKSGLLSFKTLSTSPKGPSTARYIWVHNGQIVAAANRLDQQGLVTLIEERQWLSDRVFDKVVHWCCPIDEPLGLYLKNQGVLQAQQLKQLFTIQVLQQVCALFQLQDAQFQFDQKIATPTREMTGLSVPAMEATLVGLRVLQNWGTLTDKLPDPTGGLISLIPDRPQYRLTNPEWQVWEYANQLISLEAIAQQLKLPLKQVQQIAFR